MDTKTYQFKGKEKIYSVKVELEPGGVRTDRFCPEQLLTGGITGITAINGETEEEFLCDCRKQVMVMDLTDGDTTSFDRHIAGLMAAVLDHLSQFGRIIFGDLLIYVDCFSLLLEADGYEEEEIRAIYPRMVRAIVDLYPAHVYNTADLSPFKDSPFDRLLTDLTN